MVRFIPLAATLALALLSAVQAQNGCGQVISANGTLGTFTVSYYPTFTLVTTYAMDALNRTKNYAIYCSDTEPTVEALQAAGLGSVVVGKLKVPLQAVSVGGTFASSYVELAGQRNAIKALYQATDIVSPCLQKMVEDKTIEPLVDGTPQTQSLDGGFRQYEFPDDLKDVWIPSNTKVDPLQRIEYITAVSLFFNAGNTGELVYTRIKAAYQTLERDMQQIPPANRNRIGWVFYDYTAKTWRLRNNKFTRAIIKAAGGISFPLVGNENDVQDETSMSAQEIKTLLRNSQIVIDETNFGKDIVSPIGEWRKLAGVDTAEEEPEVLKSKKVYSTDNTMNMQGISDINYRAPSRPDLLLQDLIYVQYPTYNPDYKLTFLNSGFAYGESGKIRLSSANCDSTSTYNQGEIPAISPRSDFKGNPTAPPSVVGGGIYGSGEYVPEGDGKNGGGGGGSKTGIIVAVVCVAAVLVAGFAFVFFKWTRRAKEDRFIELEEEMNNEIPLH